MPKNIEKKVYAAVVGTGAGGVVSAFILWGLGVLAWGASADAASAADAIAAVPTPVAGIIGLALTIAGTFLGGYNAEHTDRPDLHSAELDEFYGDVLDAADVTSDAGTDPKDTPQE